MPDRYRRFEIAEKAGINKTTPFKDACDRLKEHYAVTETVEELREKFAQRIQLQNENLDVYSRDLRLLGNKAFDKAPHDIFEILLIKQFIDGIRNSVPKRDC